MDSTRRRVLAGLLATVSAALAGCLEDGIEPGGSGEDDDGGSGDGERGGDDDASDTLQNEAGGYTLLETDSVRYSTNHGQTRGDAMYRSEDLERLVELEALSTDRRNVVETFVEETDFDHEVIVLAQIRVPNLCYVLDVEATGLTADGVINVTAGARDDSGDDEDCAQAEYVPAALIKLTFEDAVPDGGTVSLTDAHGDSHEFGFSVDANVGEGN